MDFFKHIFSSTTLVNILIVVSFIVILCVLYYVNHLIFKRLQKNADSTQNAIDDKMVKLFKFPALILAYWIVIKIFTHFFVSDHIITGYLNHFSMLLLVAVIAWLAVQSVQAIAYYLQSKLDVTVSDNLRARKSLTQINVFKTIANTIIIIFAIAAALMTFKQARAVGISLLTSAGIAGIIVGLAAQKSIGMILAGIQLAITQPIRLDDVVIVENEWGHIEEITLTYVVVKIWDERRLVLPVTYFLETPFQNWTRTNADILGTLFIYVDFSFPIDELRNELNNLIKNNPNWDKRVANIQVTNQTERSKELRVLVSSSDSSKNWDLKVTLREQLLDFIQKNHPESFAKIRLKQDKNL